MRANLHTSRPVFPWTAEKVIALVIGGLFWAAVFIGAAGWW